jgi:Carbohydrate-binding module 48 (Isoamylase N-terminal domain)
MTPPPESDAPLDATLRDAVSQLRAPVPSSTAARDAVKAAVRSDVATHAPNRIAISTAVTPLAGRRPNWLTTSRTVRVSPLMLMAAGLALVLGVAALTAKLRAPTSLASNATVPNARLVNAAMPGEQVMRFTLSAPTAQRVSLVGDFNNWDAAANALQQKDGTWTVVIPVAPGRHVYGFVVDGSRWIPDPAAPQSDDGDFGSANSVVYVGG